MTPHSTTSLFLDALGKANRERVSAALQAVELPVRTPLYDARDIPEYAYFLTSGFASQVVSLPGSTSIEIGVIGREGVVGSLALLGPGLSSSRCFMQSDGAGYRMPLAELRAMFLESEQIRSYVLQFTQAQMVASAYVAACNKLHGTEARLSRWLLMVQDRLETDVLPLKQEFLGMMLGTRRMTVGTAAGALQRRGLIEYSRGQIRILDREQLKAATCECYANICEAYSRLYGRGLSTR